MSSSRLQSRLRELDQDISSCEDYVARVLRRRLSAARLMVQPFVTGPCTSRLVHKEVLDKYGGRLEVTVKSKAADRNRKRSLSSSGVPGRGGGAAAAAKGAGKVSRSTSPRLKQLSWAQVLQHNGGGKKAGAGAGGGRSPPRAVCDSSSLPVVVKSKGERGSSRAGGGTVEAARDGRPRTPASTASGPSSAAPVPGSATTVSSRGAEASIRDSVVDAFSLFNPVRTLNFLIRELHGLLKECPAERGVERIVLDIEKTLQRLPQDVRSLESGAGSSPDTYIVHPASRQEGGTPSGGSPGVDVVPERGPSRLPAAALSVKESFCKTLASVPALAVRASSGREDAARGSSWSCPTAGDGAMLLQRQLEESCAKLEAMCQQMEATCAQLKDDKDKLEVVVKEREEQLQRMAMKEDDYLTTISALRANLESSTHTIEELTALTAQLRQENRVLPSLRESQFKLNQQLQDNAQANDSLRKEVRFLHLEREKLLVMNHSKDMELERFKKEILDIKALVMEQLQSLKSSVVHVDGSTVVKCAEASSSSVSDVDSRPAPGARQPVCSSPSSSRASHMAMDASWQKLSSIAPVHSRVSAPELTVLSPVRERDGETSSSTLFQSIDPDTLDATVLPGGATPAPAGQLKQELRSFFADVKRQSTLTASSLAVPSPPRIYGVCEPDGTSQWSESEDETAAPLTTPSTVLSLSEPDPDADDDQQP